VSPTTLNRIDRLLLGLAVLSLILAWASLAAIGQTDPWYRNLDMNMQNTADALAINTDLPPNLIDQPGAPMKLLLALDFRVRHYAGHLPVWNLKKLGDSRDPLRELPPLIRIGRVHARILMLAFILAAAWLVVSVTRSWNAGSLAIILLCGGIALLFHGLLTRPELLCVGFGNILALGCTWRAVEARGWPGKYSWLFFAGLLGGLSAETKLPGACYLGLCYAWCWLGALTAGPVTPEPAPGTHPKNAFWRGVIPAAGAASILGLLFHLTSLHDELGSVALLRLRVIAVFFAVLPLLAQGGGSNRFARFLLDRVGELALLGGGALASITLLYLAMRSMLTEPQASDYIARLLRCIFDPGSAMKTLLDSPRPGAVLLQYFPQNPWLFVSTPLLAMAVFRVKAVPRRLRAFLALLLAGALGITVVMSRRHFTIHYSIFPQVPLLLVWTLCLWALADWQRARQPAAVSARWGLPLAAGLAFVLVLTAYPRLQLKYQGYQDDASLPLQGYSLTFLFDHDSHTARYLQIMRQHYGDREQFARTLQRYLADPANRY
jgi:hypothetical protein